MYVCMSSGAQRGQESVCDSPGASNWVMGHPLSSSARAVRALKG